MQKTEFNNTKFRARMFCTYCGETYAVKGVDFYDGLVWIGKVGDMEEDWRWVRYEKITLEEV